MSNTKFSEGPWLYEKNGIIVAVNLPGKVLATVNSGFSDKNWEANAKLMAASPEQHDQLVKNYEMLLRCYNRLSNKEVSEEFLQELRSELVNTLKLIKKVTE